MTMPELPAKGSTNWRDTWAAAVHAAATAVTDGRLTDSALKGAFGRAVSVASYGATGDGVTDDRAAIQAALDAVAAPGGQVFFPAGDYLIGGTLTVAGGPTLHDGVTLVGAGSRCTTLRLAAGVNAPMLQTPDDGVQRHGLQVTDLGFDGAAAAQSGAAPLIAVRGMSETLWRDLYLLNPRGSALAFGQATPGMYCTVPLLDGVVIRGDAAASQGHGIELAGGSSDAIVTNCDVGFLSNGAGVLLSGHDGATVSTTNCWQTLHGFQSFASNRTRYLGCLSDYAKQHGYVTQASSDLQFDGCQAREGSQDTPQAGDGFRFEGAAADISLHGCRAMGADQRVGVALMSNLSRVRIVGGSLAGNAVAPNVIGSGVTDYRFLAVAGMADEAA